MPAELTVDVELIRYALAKAVLHLNPFDTQDLIGAQVGGRVVDERGRTLHQTLMLAEVELAKVPDGVLVVPDSAVGGP